MGLITKFKKKRSLGCSCFSHFLIYTGPETDCRILHLTGIWPFLTELKEKIHAMQRIGKIGLNCIHAGKSPFIIFPGKDTCENVHQSPLYQE